MTNFSNNRFDVLNDDATDTLGNTKPVAATAIDKKNDGSRPKRDAARKVHHRIAVSPPSHRRGRDRGSEDDTHAAFGGDRSSGGGIIKEGARPPRGRQFDRHSGTGIHDNLKKTNQGWGHPGRAEQDAVHDVLSHEDPGFDGAAGGSGSATPVEANYKTLDEYQADQDLMADRFRLLEARAPNEGSDESQWKNGVPLERNKDDDYYFGGKEYASKQKNKNKKEKVYIMIDQPSHRQQQQQQQQQRGGRGGRGNGSEANVNIPDSSAFPTLGA